MHIIPIIQNLFKLVLTNHHERNLLVRKSTAAGTSLKTLESVKTVLPAGLSISIFSGNSEPIYKYIKSVGAMNKRTAVPS